MANIRFHRCGGFTFNNVTVNNTNDIYLLDVARPQTSIKTRYDFIVPLRNGSQTIQNRYEDTYIDVIVAFYDIDVEIRRQKQRDILSKFVDVSAKLIFLDEPTLFYVAEVIDSIEVTESEVFTEVTIHFKASYCKYGAEHSITLVKGNNNIANNGNYKAETLIEIAITANSTNVIIGNGVNSFTLSNLLAGETIYIDSEKMIAYKLVSGVKQSVLTRFTGYFWQLAKGTSTINLSGTFTGTVKLKYKDTYIV